MIKLCTGHNGFCTIYFWVSLIAFPIVIGVVMVLMYFCVARKMQGIKYHCMEKISYFIEINELRQNYRVFSLKLYTHWQIILFLDTKHRHQEEDQITRYYMYISSLSSLYVWNFVSVYMNSAFNFVSTAGQLVST